MNTPSELNERFLQQLQRLNPEQLLAVQQVEGPVLVLAGPGTGKTQVLATRIGSILLHTDARPQNILCLTFTDAGVIAMRERLLGLIGPDAHRVPVMTYHSFCNRVIQENAAEFGARPLQTVSELERIGIIRNLLDELPPAHPLRLGYKNQYQLEGALGRLFAQMKTAGWKPGDLHRAVDSWLKSLPEQEGFVYKKDTEHGKKGSLKVALVKTETDRMERLKAGADMYPIFNQALKKADRYEFEDMLLWTIRLFQREEGILRTYQERYQYVLVDEFQDTNGAQNQLLNLLLQYWEQPNVFAVGDDDQSVYEFQGARLHNLIDFYQQYSPGLEVIVLKENYRSAQPILDAAQRLIQYNELRAVRQLPIEVEKHLQARSAEASCALRKARYSNRLVEDLALVNQIQQLLVDGVPPTEIAIICAKHRQFERILPLLDRAGIAYQAKRPLNLLEMPLIRQLRTIFEYLAAEQAQPFSGDALLFKILHAGYFKIDPFELAAFTASHSQEEQPLRLALLEKNWPVAHALVHLPSELYVSLPELADKVLNELHILSYVLELDAPAMQLELLYSWQNFIQETAIGQPDLSLSQFLELIERMEDNALTVPFLQSIRMQNGIQLLTAHSSKGLEFEWVFLPDCTVESWEPSSRANLGSFPLPPTITYSNGEEDALEARRRLFYVAMTRAKKGLHLSFAEKGYNGKPAVPCRFWEETGIPEERVAVDSIQQQAAVVLALTAPPVPVVHLPNQAVVDVFLEHFSMSPRALNKYLRCRLAFYYEEVLKAPLRPSENSLTGAALHKALQVYFGRIQKMGSLPDKQELLDLFIAEMEHVRVFFRNHHFQQRLSTGLYALDQYWVTQIPYWRKRARLELSLRTVEWEGIRLAGVLDKVEISEEGALRIVDYKTGVYQPGKVAAPSEEQPFGGDYYRQLHFYKLLLEQSRLFSGPITSAVIDWVEPDRKGIFHKSELTFNASTDQWMRDLVKTTYESIQRADFSPGCGQPDCSWCRLQRERLLQDPVWQPELDLDDLSI